MRSARLLWNSTRKAYQNFLIRRPLLAQAVQVSVLMGIGDIIAQTVVEKTKFKDIDKIRTIKFAALGCLVGPTLRVWYGQLDKVSKLQRPAWQIVFIKVGMDQILFAPIFLGSLTATMSILQGMDMPTVKKRLENEYWAILRANYCVWPAVQLLNFSIVPLNYQVIFAQTVAIAWNTFLSTMLN